MAYMYQAEAPLPSCHFHPGEKDRANARLARALLGTTRLCTVVCEIITVLRLVMPKRAGTNGSKINDAVISTLK